MLGLRALAAAARVGAPLRPATAQRAWGATAATADRPARVRAPHRQGDARPTTARPSSGGARRLDARPQRTPSPRQSDQRVPRSGSGGAGRSGGGPRRPPAPRRFDVLVRDGDGELRQLVAALEQDVMLYGSASESEVAAILRRCASEDRHESAAHVYRIFRSVGGVPSIDTLNTVLAMSTPVSRLGLFFRAISDMRLLQLRPNLATCHAMMEQYANQGRLRRAQGILNLLDKLEIPPTPETFARLIDLLSSHARFADVDRMFQRASQMRKITPAVVIAYAASCIERGDWPYCLSTVHRCTDTDIGPVVEGLLLAERVALEPRQVITLRDLLARKGIALAPKVAAALVRRVDLLRNAPYVGAVARDLAALEDRFAAEPGLIDECKELFDQGHLRDSVQACIDHNNHEAERLIRAFAERIGVFAT